MRRRRVRLPYEQVTNAQTQICLSCGLLSSSERRTQHFDRHVTLDFAIDNNCGPCTNRMPPRLIINADDFGLTPGVNRAIAELHQANALTSATLMATGAAFDDAVAVAHANPTLGVGCHIVLTDGVPVSPPESIPTLIGPDGKNFRPSLVDFIQALLRGTIREDDIEREAARPGAETPVRRHQRHPHRHPQAHPPLPCQ